MESTTKLTTHQPPKGRGNRGELRFGEMERDAAISYNHNAFFRAQLYLNVIKFRFPPKTCL